MSEEKKAPTRPLPKLTELDTAEFWRGTKNQEFRYQKCANCGTVVWHPRAHCTGCVDGDLQWHTSAGQGTVYSYSIVRLSYHPFFRGKAPYAVAYVDLDEGPRFLSRGCLDMAPGCTRLLGNSTRKKLSYGSKQEAYFSSS